MRSNDETGVLPFYYFEPSQYYYTPPYVTAQPDVSVDNRHLCYYVQSIRMYAFRYFWQEKITTLQSVLFGVLVTTST